MLPALIWVLLELLLFRLERFPRALLPPPGKISLDSQNPNFRVVIPLGVVILQLLVGVPHLACLPLSALHCPTQVRWLWYLR